MRLLRPLRVTAETPTSVLVREAFQRAAVSAVLFGLFFALGNAFGRAVVAALVFAVVGGAFFLVEILWRRRAARRLEGAEPVPLLERPSYHPSHWPDDALTHWAMRTPLRALLTFAAPALAAAGLLFWRVADRGSFARTLGDATGDVAFVVAPVALGYCWFFGVRAWTALRDGAP